MPPVVVPAQFAPGGESWILLPHECERVHDHRQAFRPGILAGFLGVTLAAWVIVVARMRGMDAGPGTDLGSLGWYLGIWVTMMAAMMLPSAAPMVLLFSKISEQSSRRPGAGDGAVRGGLSDRLGGVRARRFAIFRLVRALDPPSSRGTGRERRSPAAALVLAGVYQLTPLKRACLRIAARRSAS